MKSSSLVCALIVAVCTSGFAEAYSTKTGTPPPIVASSSNDDGGGGRRAALGALMGGGAAFLTAGFVVGGNVESSFALDMDAFMNAEVRKMKGRGEGV